MYLKLSGCDHMGLKYRCKKCGTEFEVEYDVVCPNCRERHEVETMRMYLLRTKSRATEPPQASGVSPKAGNK